MISSDVALEKLPIENREACRLRRTYYRLKKRFGSTSFRGTFPWLGGGAGKVPGNEVAVWVPINVFSLKWSTAGASAVRFRILSKTKKK